MLIRFFREVDYLPVSQLLNEVYRDPTRMTRWKPDRLRTEFKTRGTNPHENCVVLEDAEGDLVGFCGYEPMAGGRALLDGPVLHQEVRGRGWGQRLWQEVSSLLKVRGIRTVSAVLGAGNDRALSFLTDLGFRRDKTDVIVVNERKRQHPVEVPEGVSIRCGGDDLDPAAYEDLHSSLFARRSLAYLGVLFRNPDYLLFTAECQGELVGHLELEILGEVATIEAFGVLPDFRRRGIGKALLARALNHAWQQPGVDLVRQIWKTSEPGFLKVYLELGFTEKASIHALTRILEP
ncbi:MAG: GNAT family N-acetyltransferase [Candidatus Eremiobacteraeota bacterium]|nr:GNAT family N-acetyltransferase [Candidatus Eremiobacteraeota bacterium]